MSMTHAQEAGDFSLREVKYGLAQNVMMRHTFNYSSAC